MNAQNDAGDVGQRADVELRLPADSAYVLVLRTAAAGLAARLDFPLDDIEDIRTAVDEATSMLLTQATPGSHLECGFALRADTMVVTLSADCASPHEPDRDSFSWQVLAALTSSVHAEAGTDRLTLELTAASTSSAPSGGVLGASVGS